MPPETITLDNQGFEVLAKRIARLAAAKADERVIIGIGGIAGSGKSTLAARLARKIPGSVAIGLDGFHFTNARLRELGNYERKGAPDTYHVNTCLALLRKYRDASAHGPYPIYDRENSHEPITAPDEIDSSVRVLIGEGQFMLLDQPPWDEFAGVFDEGWWLSTPIGTARDWTIDRHIRTGRTREQAETKWLNDHRNAHLIQQQMRRFDLRFDWPWNLLHR